MLKIKCILCFISWQSVVNRQKLWRSGLSYNCLSISMILISVWGQKCWVSYNLEWLSLVESQLNSFFSGLRELELETPDKLSSSLSPEILSERFSLQDAGLTSDQASIFTLTAESQRLGRRQLELSNNDLSSVSAELVARAVMRLEMVNLEQCHLLLSQMVTVFNLITESEHLQLIRTPFIDSKA